jgi:hypothetical protein
MFEVVLVDGSTLLWLVAMYQRDGLAMHLMALPSSMPKRSWHRCAPSLQMRLYAATGAAVAFFIFQNVRRWVQVGMHCTRCFADRLLLRVRGTHHRPASRRPASLEAAGCRKSVVMMK